MYRSLHHKNLIVVFSLLFACINLLPAEAQDASGEDLVILYMNDTHSRIEPMPKSDSRNPDKGGVVRQNTYIKDVRSKNKNVLLFHCGDFVQGTPYFNLFSGETEVAVMNYMKFNAVTIGNHEFDNGLESLAEMIRKSEFPYVSTNLDFTGTPVEGLTKPFLIIQKGNIRVGIIGLTIDPDGLVTKKSYEGMKWNDPIASANQMADYLRNEEKCDLIVCLSHLGLYFSEEKVGDISLAKQSRNIDIILGGHTHTFLRFPEKIKNIDEKEVIISQMGGNGIYVGRMDVNMKEVEK